MTTEDDGVNAALRALSNDRRRLILDWLKHPKQHFRAQVDGDLVAVRGCRARCAGPRRRILIAEKLGVSQPTVSEHLKILSQAGLLKSKRIKQWTFYRRNEAAILAIKRSIVANL